MRDLLPPARCDGTYCLANLINGADLAAPWTSAESECGNGGCQEFDRYETPPHRDTLPAVGAGCFR